MGGVTVVMSRENIVEIDIGRCGRKATLNSHTLRERIGVRANRM
jgi:hypothetical protein